MIIISFSNFISWNVCVHTTADLSKCVVLKKIKTRITNEEKATRKSENF